MAAITTNIPADTLPVELAQPNRIATTYDSFTLLPRLGPLTYFKAKRSAWDHLRQLNAALRFLEETKAHQDQFGELPSISEAVLTIVFTLPFQENPPFLGGLRRPVTLASTIPVRGTGLLRAFRTLQGDVVSAVSRKRRVGSSRATLRDQLIAESEQTILQTLKGNNRVIHRMAQSGQLLAEDGTFRDDLLSLSAGEQAGLLVQAMAEPRGQATRLSKSIAGIVLGEAVPKDGPQRLGSIGAIVQKDDDVRVSIEDTLADILSHEHDGLKPDDISESPVVNSREWAFLRLEELEITFGKPVLRGPFSVKAVAPNSTLTVSDSLLISDQAETAIGNLRTTARGSGIMLANQLQEKLGGRFDYGTNLGQGIADGGFSQDMQTDAKRSTVLQTLTEFSEANAAQTISTTSSDTTRTREYITNGKDPLRATSEVAYEAAVPIDVKHYLRGLQLVWSPRVDNPFQSLRDSIDSFRDGVEADFSAENYVTDPREPVETFDSYERIAARSEALTRDYIDSNEGEVIEAKIIIRLSDADRQAGFQLSDDVQCELVHDEVSDPWPTHHYWLRKPKVEINSSAGAASITVRVLLHIFNDDNRPNTIWISASVTKFKLTDAYRQQVAEYTRQVQDLNPARREAVKVQARRYGRLRTEELIARYEDNSEELKDYAFHALMKEMFGAEDGDWSYYAGVIKSCIDWEKARLQMEPADPTSLGAEGRSPYHFMNVRGARFFLPLRSAAEGAFFDLTNAMVDAEWIKLFETVRDYVTKERILVARLNASQQAADRRQIELDSYSSELVLGHHLEAVLSNHDFRVP